MSNVRFLVSLSKREWNYSFITKFKSSLLRRWKSAYLRVQHRDPPSLGCPLSVSSFQIQKGLFIHHASYVSSSLCHSVFSEPCRVLAQCWRLRCSLPLAFSPTLGDMSPGVLLRMEREPVIPSALPAEYLFSSFNQLGTSTATKAPGQQDKLGFRSLLGMSKPTSFPH